MRAQDKVDVPDLRRFNRRRHHPDVWPDSAPIFLRERVGEIGINDQPVTGRVDDETCLPQPMDPKTVARSARQDFSETPLKGARRQFLHLSVPPCNAKSRLSTAILVARSTLSSVN